MGTLKRAVLSLASLSLAFAPHLARSQTFSVPNTFVPGTPATAADVNANFSAAAAAINGKQNLVVLPCPSGSAIQGINANGTVVCQQLNFFGGDGSAGNLTISANTDWSVTPPVNLNFANVTINAGQTLTVPAGTTIRCSGTFTNNGTLSVAAGARMGGLNNFSFSASVDIYSIGHPGDSLRPASGGSYDSSGGTHTIQGGLGGDGIPRTTAMTSFNSFRIGGGSGAGWRDNGEDGNGGGLVKIYCTGNVANAGTINANGTTPTLLSGGGGGGIVVLASTSSITSAGAINVSGGNGGPSFAFGGAGGGGGGGIVVLAAPTIGPLGTINVSGGSGGSVAAQVSTTNRYGGGGGGASGGNGGNGSSISATSPVTAGTPTSGSAGYVLSITANPAFLLH